MRSVIVTGGFGPLGTAVAQAFVAQGDKVARVDFAARASAPIDGMLDLGGVDLTEASAAASCVEIVRSQHGGIDILANVAGGFAWETLEDGNPESGRT